MEYDDFTVLISPCVYMGHGSFQVNPPSKCGNLRDTTGTICDSADGPTC